VPRTFETLSKAHDRESFDCGVAELNGFLRRNARQQQQTGVSRTLVLVDQDAAAPKPISGFFTLVAAQIDTALLDDRQSKRLPHNAPCILLARLAVDRREQSKGFGKALLAEAVLRTLSVSEQVGVAGTLIDAKDDAAANYYQKFGFVPFPSNPLRLFQALSAMQIAPNK
jgi:GNAT superfamily N-acetyltransferase